MSFHIFFLAKKNEFDCMRLVTLVGRLWLPKLVGGNKNIVMVTDTKGKDTR